MLTVRNIKMQSSSRSKCSQVWRYSQRYCSKMLDRYHSRVRLMKIAMMMNICFKKKIEFNNYKWLRFFENNINWSIINVTITKQLEFVLLHLVSTTTSIILASTATTTITIHPSSPTLPCTLTAISILPPISTTQPAALLSFTATIRPTSLILFKMFGLRAYSTSLH